MRYKVIVRPLSDDDAGKDSPLPDIDDDVYDLHLKALVDDVRDLPGVTYASVSNDEITIESSLDKKSLKDAMKQIFVRDFDQVRFVGIEVTK